MTSFQISGRHRLFFLSVVLAVFIFCSTINSASAADNDLTKPKKEVVLINSFASVLDRDGHRENVTDIYDSFKSSSLYVCAGKFGQSPIYRIPKRDVASIELDGFYQNMSGWDYAACTVTLLNGKKQSGYIVAFHMGLMGYRTFQGKCEVGEYMISWKRLKKIDFLGRWIEAPAETGKYKQENYDEDKGN